MKRRVDELGWLQLASQVSAGALVGAGLIALARLVHLVDDAHDIDLDLDPQENPSS